jgi:iron complex outermembrane receptor protein
MTFTKTRIQPRKFAHYNAITIFLVMLLQHESANAVDAIANEDVISVQVNGSLTNSTPEFTKLQIDKSSPQTYLTNETIQKIASPFSDYGTLANFTPSFVSSAPNGNGFDAAKNQTLRGFADGQFNVTLDGIPFADPDGVSHHSTSYFPAATIDHMVIDRSPGSATDLGYATIGGSMNVNSLQIPLKAENYLYGSYGSFATSQAGARLNTAKPAEDGQTGFMVNVEHMQSDGALSHADGRKDDLLLKTESRFGGATLTAFYAYDRYHFNNPSSVTTAQIAAYGTGFGFTAVPGTPDYFGYSTTDRSSDFGYVRLQSSLNAWHFDEKLYTYAYRNNGLSLKGDDTASPIGNGYGVPSTDIGGRVSNEHYRTFGNIVEADHQDSMGVFRGGLWLEHSREVYYRNALDLSTGAVYDANKNADSPVLFNYESTLNTVEPFAEYEWKASDALTVRPGLRYQRVSRGFDASVVPNSLPGTNGEVGRSVHSTLPSLDGHYALTPNMQMFAQWSKGALVPNQSFFYSSNPTAGNQAQPETSRALQAGITIGSTKASLTLDAYQIKLDNYVSTVTVAGNTEYVNDGAVRYRGIELEGNRFIGAGFRIIGNASVVRAQFEESGITSPAQLAGDDIPLAPRYIGLLGVLYEHDMWSGSLLTKFIGSEYQGKNGSSDGTNYLVGAYSYTNLNIARSMTDLTGIPNARIGFSINNLLNQAPVTDTAGPSAAGPLLVNVLARRNFLLSLSGDF